MYILVVKFKFCLPVPPGYPCWVTGLAGSGMGWPLRPLGRPGNFANYLADAHYPACDHLLVPYCGVRYHLREWDQGQQWPQNARHAQLQNVVEHIFGVVQKCFKMMWCEAQFPIAYQSKAVLVMLALHNFIQANDPSDLNEEAAEDFPDPDGTEFAAGSNTRQTAAEMQQANLERHVIEEEMWNNYI